ncbi:uncharacterized protein BCR38DRAFT_343124 [Pseudomassariella vexata]|uniref:Transcription factor domain-containing protein n=1 Tax=Pseudomassariella vexata TaxID=1141098 RepID=A0A1Y2DZ18_9PEZI|nr:uncharacterized protein BCR38DRAFT_343124 [Pseudomassariella vexata]ORY64477.1 hypothetical protein BCR38DRAFT_343124 [Pseudomassariella vexata]
MTEVLDNISTIGTNHDIQSSHIAPNSALPCSDSLWALPGSAIDEWSIGQYRYSSSFALCIILSVTELHKIHQFLQTPCDMNDLEKMYEWQTGAQRIDESLTMWREDFVAAVFRLINAESSHEMEPYVVLTNCVLNTAVITLFQARSPCPAGIDKTTEPWSYATTRCVYACENMAHKIRRMSEDETRNCNPHLLYSIFVAARFYIVYSKALDADVPINLHSLAFALRTASVRWPLARCCETVIRTAVAEHRTPVETSSLPKEFYDLRYSSVEILDILLTWTQNCPPGMGICDIGTENTE